MQIEPNEEDFTGPTQGNNKLIGLLYAAYFFWSKFVVRHRFAIIALCSLLSTLGAIKIAKTPFGNNIMGFTPYGARSLAESAIRDQFFNSSEGKGAFGVFLLVKPKKEGQNMLREEMLKEVIRIDDLVNWNISLRNAAENKSEPFAEFCLDFCNINEPIRLFWQGFQTKQQNEDNFEEEKIELDYPTIKVFGRRMNIQPYFHGVKFAPENGTKGQSNMEFVEMIGLIYREQRGNGLLDEEVKEYEMAVSKFLEKEFKSDLVRVLSISTSYVEAEFVRANLSMLPFLGIGLTVMLICTSICIPLSAAYFQQASVHKISLAVVACICPFMATGTALGLLFLCGLRFSPILCATPFLVLAIGVDDAYLMSHAWNRLAKTCNFQRIVPKGGNVKNEKAENEEDEKIVANLLAMVLMDTGPAILISALANISADAIGAFIGSPEITILCVGNATALTFDFLFQCTYFVGVMATIGLIERKEMRKKMAKAIEKRGNGNIQQQGIEQRGWQKRFHDSLKTFVTKFVNFYTNSICNPFCAIFVVLCSALFIGFSIFAITKFEVNMSTKQLYSQDSPLLEIENIRENRINPFYTQATVFVNNFGNLSNQSRVAEIDKFVGEFEHLNESWGPQSSMYFLRDLREYLAKREEENEDQIGQILNGKSTNKSKEVEMNDFDCQELMAFLDEAEYSHWRGFVRLEENGANSSSPNSSCPIQRFFFTTAFHDPKLFKWSERVELLRKWRQIVDENEKSIDASVYHEEGIYLDLMDNMPTDTWQSAVATLICMAAICLLLLHDLRTVLVTTTVIAIIIVETMGILSISGVALNQLMMGSLVISIGFSVDLPAHFSYHFLTSDGSKDSSTKSKLKATIRAVGLPSVQASLSTSLCVLSHYWIQLYIAQIFVRIICLTICLCLLNTLVVLPALLFLIGLFGANLKVK